MNCFRYCDIHIGQRAEFTVVITDNMMMQFTEISGDTNPVHLDDDYATSLNYKRRVVYGMLTSAFYSTLVGTYLPGQHALLHGMELTFHRPAYIGEELRVVGEVMYKNDAYRQIEIKAYITNPDNNKISRAKIKAGVSQ